MSIEVMKKALGALYCINSPLYVREIERVGSAMSALRQAIAEAKRQKPVAFRNTETGEFCTGGFLRKDLAKWQPLYAAPVHAIDIPQERVDETPPCKTHPDAPHGFDRNASHSADRYVCECEGWEPPPVEAWYDPTNHVVSTDKNDPRFTPLGQLWKLVPERGWVSLTDEDIAELHNEWAQGNLWNGWNYERALESKLKEKNA